MKIETSTTYLVNAVELVLHILQLAPESRQVALSSLQLTQDLCTPGLARVVALGGTLGGTQTRGLRAT